MQWVRLLAVPLAAALLAGCARGPVDIYAVEWTYSATNYVVDGQVEPFRNDEMNEPLLIDRFQAESDANWTMTVTSRLDAGTYELHMRGPHGAVVSVAVEDGTYRFDGMKGRWTVEILTDADDRGFPAGTIEVSVRG